ncbi:hypothetical protein [Rudaea sp.]|uniref:hypothetical protein n=1 Tax=Rudaea sp. TaxID=2136325 RepID=UPI00321FC12B
MTSRTLAFARHSRAGGNPVTLFSASGVESKSFHSSCGRAGNFSLLVQRKVTKRNTPQSIAPAAHRARRVRASGRVPLTAHPCAGSGIGAIHRAAPCGAFPTAVAAMQWGPGKARAARSCAQKQEQKQKRRASLLLIWLLIFHPLHRTEHRRRRRGKGAHVRAQGCASSRRPAGAEKRRALSRSESAVSGVCFFGYFLCTSKESNPLAEGEWKLLLPKNQIINSNSPIPACTEMTSKNGTSMDKADEGRAPCA